MKTFFRVCNEKTTQGLWYTAEGEHTGLIHNEFSFCENRELAMPFDSELVGWLSVTDTLDGLFQWFTKDDIRKLQEHGWFIHIYESDEDKVYLHDEYSHIVIRQSTAKVLAKVVI